MTRKQAKRMEEVLRLRARLRESWRRSGHPMPAHLEAPRPGIR